MSQLANSLKLIKLLKEKGKMKSTELAKEIGCTQRMIREYVKAINKETNVKIHTKTGSNGGYYLTCENSSYPSSRKNFFSLNTKKIILKTLLRCKAEELGKLPGRRDCPSSYYQNANKLFGSWENFIKECGYHRKGIKTVESLTKDKAQEIIREKAKELGRIPRRYEIVNGDSIASGFGWNKIVAETFNMRFKNYIEYRVTEAELLRNFRKNINKIFKKKKIKYLGMTSYDQLRIKGTQCGHCILNHLNEVSWKIFYKKYVLDEESYILNFSYEYNYICNILNKKIITSREYDKYQKHLSRRYLENKSNLTWHELVGKIGFKNIKKNYTEEEWEKIDKKIIILRSEKLSYVAIGKQLGISNMTVKRRLAKINTKK